MNVLVSGATGFIGRHLARLLADQGKYKVVCLVRNQKKAEALLPRSAIPVYSDINAPDLAARIKPYDIHSIFHCAGYVGKNARLLRQVNVKGTENICSLAFSLGVERLVHVSSVAVVNGHEQVPLSEDLGYKANSIYGESKIEAEKKVFAWRSKGLPAVIIRPPMIYGEGEPHLQETLLKLLQLRLLPLVDKGRHVLHMAYVKNVAAAMVFSLRDKVFLDGTYFVADQEVLTQKDIFSLWCRARNAPQPWSLPDGIKSVALLLPGINRALSFFLKDRIYDLDRIRSAGFVPPYPAGESLLRSARFNHG